MDFSTSFLAEKFTVFIALLLCIFSINWKTEAIGIGPKEVTGGIQPIIGIIGTEKKGGGGNSESSSESNEVCPLNRRLLDAGLINSTKEDVERCNANNTISCEAYEKSKYRSIDGRCNNLKHPWWGKSDSCLHRILPYDYADGKSNVRISCTSNPLPNARHVSNVFHQTKKKRKDLEHTTYYMEWGQVIAHDLSLNDIYKTPESNYLEGYYCCENGPVTDGKCMSAAVPPDDPFYPKVSTNITCVNYVRTTPCKCHSDDVEQRMHWNQNTAFHDLSIVYGSTDERAAGLRSYQNGKLRVERTSKSGDLPPKVPIEENCFSPSDEPMCYHSGDSRTNQQIFILAMHVLLLRHHNYICDNLKIINPNWNDTELYQNARKINIAIAQYITYQFHIPRVIGKDNAKKAGLKVMDCTPKGYTKYDPDVDPSTIDEFTSAVMRWGHPMLQDDILQVDPVNNDRSTIRLKDTYYNLSIFDNGQFELQSKGMTEQCAGKRDQFVTGDARNHLFEILYFPFTNLPYGIDLATVSILRGREHGIPGYAYYLKYLFNYTVNNFEDLKELNIMPSESVDELADLYKSPYDVDLYSAGFAEYNVKGGIVGPTFAAIIKIQLQNTRDGDRYYFEHGNQAGSFTQAQLLEIKGCLGIRKFNPLSRIICEVTKTRSIQNDVFLKPDLLKNPVIPCEMYPKMNFSAWKEVKLE